MEVEALDRCSELAQQLRVDSVHAATAAGSGHPTSSIRADIRLVGSRSGGSIGEDGPRRWRSRTWWR